MLTKTQAVLRHRREGTLRVEFHCGSIPPDFVLSLDRERWVDMGEPEEITVSITPGDRLNP